MSEATPITYINLMRPAPGIVRCCICFEARPIAELLLDVESGQHWDLCAAGTCAQEAGVNPDGSLMTPQEVPHEQ